MKPRWQTVQRKCFSAEDFIVVHRGEAYKVKGGRVRGKIVISSERSVFCIRIGLDNWPEDKPNEQGSILSENQNQEHRAFSTLWYVRVSKILSPTMRRSRRTSSTKYLSVKLNPLPKNTSHNTVIRTLTQSLIGCILFLI